MEYWLFLVPYLLISWIVSMVCAYHLAERYNRHGGSYARLAFLIGFYAVLICWCKGVKEPQETSGESEPVRLDRARRERKERTESRAQARSRQIREELLQQHRSTGAT